MAEQTHRGWDIVRLTNGALEVDVVPGKGGDIIALRHNGTNLLWESPWGLKPRGEQPKETTSAQRWLEMYPGGWQTIFPNGGDESEGSGFHGEAALVPWAVEAEDGSTIAMSATLNGFELKRVVRLDTEGVDVTEAVRNAGPGAREAMWSHHPAFGAPFISGSTHVDCGARTFVAGDARDVAAGDLEPGATSRWPLALRRDGTLADLRALPPDRAPLDRFGYLTNFTGGWATISSKDLTVRLGWNADVFPCAWYWLEARATQDFPWFGKAYVFAIEPASTWPGQGIENARVKGNGPLRFEPGQSRTARIRLTVTPR